MTLDTLIDAYAYKWYVTYTDSAADELSWAEHSRAEQHHMGNSESENNDLLSHVTRKKAITLYLRC